MQAERRAGPMTAGQSPGGGNSAVFNQPLTPFLVSAMVWRLTVSALCSYWQSRRGWMLFRSPWAWAAADGLRGGLGGVTSGPGKGGGSGKRAGASQDRGKSIPPHSLLPSMDFWGWRKTGRVVLCNPGLKLSVAYSGLSKFKVFIKLVLNRNCGILIIGRTIRSRS